MDTNRVLSGCRAQLAGHSEPSSFAAMWMYRDARHVVRQDSHSAGTALFQYLPAYQEVVPRIRTDRTACWRAPLMPTPRDDILLEQEVERVLAGIESSNAERALAISV